jgi:DNA polymerase
MSSDVDEVARQARDVIAAARALVAEWAEEGIDAFDPAATRSAPSEPITETAEAPEAEPMAQVASSPAPQSDPKPPEPTIRVAAPARGQDRAMPADAMFDAAVTLEHVRETLGDCTRCGLSEGRQRIVFGDGNPDAEILFIGEGPGQSEDEQGLPFVGRAGELLTQMIEKGMGLSRSDVYICNIVKCRPPKNRNPLPDEVAACRPFLDGQIAAVKPKVIVALGKPAAGLLLGREVAITRIRGTWHDYRGIPLMPTLHPAYVLRQYTAENRRAVWEDLKAALAKTREDGD